MSRIALMSQRRIQGFLAGLRLIDVNDIFLIVIDGRNHVKSRA